MTDRDRNNILRKGHLTSEEMDEFVFNVRTLRGFNVLRYTAVVLSYGRLKSWVGDIVVWMVRGMTSYMQVLKSQSVNDLFVYKPRHDRVIT